jgi:hypothetical protein
MSEFGNSYFDARPAFRRVGQFDPAIRAVRLRTADELRYSSPWPWLGALVISLSMWASLGWLIWGR